MGARHKNFSHGSAGVLAGRVINTLGRKNRAATFEARQWRAFIIYTTGGDAGAPMAPMTGKFYHVPASQLFSNKYVTC